jgi:hypothetical protein
MQIHRIPRNDFCTAIGNEVLRDTVLSYTARGILGYLLSLPDGYRIDIHKLADRAPEGRQRVAASLRELEERGYLKRVGVRTSAGHLHTEFYVFDTLDRASPDPPDPRPPKSGIPTPGDRPVRPCDDKPIKEQCPPSAQ